MLRFPQAVAMIALVALAACAPKPSAPPPGAAMTVGAAELSAVEVTIADSVRYNVFPRFDGETDEAVSARVIKTLTAQVEADARAAFTGTRPVRLMVELTLIDVASGAGRALMQSSSMLHGQVQIVDAASGEVSETTMIVAEDKAAQATGNIGGLIAMAVNIADASGTDRFETLSAEFAQKTGEWLRR